MNCGLLFLLVAYVSINIVASIMCGLLYSDGEKPNLYLVLGFLPAHIIIGFFYTLVKIWNFLFFSDLGQKIHKFMIQDPRDLIKFRIKLERK